MLKVFSVLPTPPSRLGSIASELCVITLAWQKGWLSDPGIPTAALLPRCPASDCVFSLPPPPQSSCGSLVPASLVQILSPWTPALGRPHLPLVSKHSFGDSLFSLEKGPIQHAGAGISSHHDLPYRGHLTLASLTGPIGKL